MSQPSTLNPLQGYKKNSVFYREPLVVPCPFGAVHTIPGDGEKIRVFLVERSPLENEQDVLRNPRLQIADREKNALRLESAVFASLLTRSPAGGKIKLYSPLFRHNTDDVLRHAHRAQRATGWGKYRTSLLRISDYPLKGSTRASQRLFCKCSGQMQSASKRTSRSVV
jgi:hypothetical protein